MNQREKEKWEEIRNKGKRQYVIKNTIIAFTISVLLFVLTNGYMEKEATFVEYLKANFVDRAEVNYTIMLVAFIGIYIVSSIAWNVTEKIYNKSIQEEDKA